MFNLFIKGKLYQTLVCAPSRYFIHVLTRGVNKSNARTVSFLTRSPKLDQSNREIHTFVPINFSSRGLLNKHEHLSFGIPDRSFTHFSICSNTLYTTHGSITTDRPWAPSRTVRGLPLPSPRRLLSTPSSGGEGAPPLRSVEDVAAYLTTTASSVLVMAGAGISTASGIPDFRSPGTGLYHNLQKYNLPYPEAIFDIHYFMMDPRPFVSLAQELYPGVKYRPNAAHWFLRLLQLRGKLRRVYTQNIDGLERQTGLLPPALVEAHGSFSSASCTLCGAAHPPEDVKASILHKDGVPQCGVGGCKGKVKPDIVFFGENLPNEFWQFEDDLHAVDLLLIMGTSLEVHPFASIAERARSVTPRVLVNRGRAGSMGSRPRDCLLLGDIVDTVTALAEACGWGQDLQELMNS